MNRRIRKKRAKKLFRKAALFAASSAAWRAVAERITKNHKGWGAEQAACECHFLARQADIESLTVLSEGLRLIRKV